MPMNEINIMGFWDRFDEARPVTIEQVAIATGLNQGSLRNLRSSRKLPNLADTVVIADYLNVSLDWLVLGKVSDERDTEIGRILKAYLESDELTRMMVRKLLNM